MGYIGWVLIAAIIVIALGSSIMDRKPKPEYSYVDKAEYGMPHKKGLKVWVYAPDMSQGKAIAEDVVKAYGKGYDEVTTFLHPPRGTSDLYVPKEGMAQHSYTWTRHGGIKQDF